MMLSNIFYLAKYLGGEKLESMFYDLDNPNPNYLDRFEVPIDIYYYLHKIHLVIVLVKYYIYD